MAFRVQEIAEANHEMPCSLSYGTVDYSIGTLHLVASGMQLFDLVGSCLLYSPFGVVVSSYRDLQPYDLGATCRADAGGSRVSKASIFGFRASAFRAACSAWVHAACACAPVKASESSGGA